MSKSVSDIIVERLLKKIEEEKQLPWQKPFACSSINWMTEKEYIGINKILLGGGEYITPNQLKSYNEKTGKNYWFEKGTPYDIVVYYGPTFKELSNSEVEEMKSKGVRKSWVGNIVSKDGKYLLRKWILRYYRVYNIKYIRDKEGNQLPNKLGSIIEERYEKPEEIIKRYMDGSGVKLDLSSRDGAYYREDTDTVYLPEMKYFNSSESFYRVLFHELAHSTGVEKRLNRECFKKYHNKIEERSREELIAEMSSLLLASESGFSEETAMGENSDSYIIGWAEWMRNNSYEVVLGMQQAEKVKRYILQGGVLDKYDDMSTEIDI